MNSKTLMLASFIAVTFVFMQCHGQMGEIPEGNQEERELCEDNVVGQNVTVESVTKLHKLDCKATCTYSDNTTDVVNSPDDQPCSLVIRLMPTGKCSGGTCQIFKLFP